MTADQNPSAHGSGETTASYGSPKRKRTRIHHLQQMKERGEPWPMLTSYDVCGAIFDQAGIPVLLVGDSAANNVYGYGRRYR